ncbi:hypothetical protein M8J75_006384 [Diaphorina citri]|nr:hypothetical protein M8J75_006384 [Diaphorina citri]
MYLLRRRRYVNRGCVLVLGRIVCGCCRIRLDLADRSAMPMARFGRDLYVAGIWFFERISAQSHLPGLALNSKVVLAQRDSAPFDSSWLHCDHRNVFVRTLWDNPRLYDEVGQPLYILWTQNEKQSSLVSALVTDRTNVPRSVMHSVIASVRCSDLSEPLKRLSSERHKMKLSGVNRALSLYREILFLAITEVGRENINQAAFDREYAAAFESLPSLDSKLYLKCDQPLSSAALFVRHFFKELEL